MSENESLFQSSEPGQESPDQKPAAAASKPKAPKLQVQLPYLASPGTIKTALEKVRQASLPEKFTTDFVSAKLGMKGGSGAAIVPFFKKLGLVAPDGVPTELYKRFRNTSTGGSAIAEALKRGYKPLLDTHEYFFELSDKELASLIVQVTGAEAGSSTSRAILYAIKALKEFASFSSLEIEPEQNEVGLSKEFNEPPVPPARQKSQEALGLNLAYTINLNLPATSDIAVFNAIFKSLKEHLLSDAED